MPRHRQLNTKTASQGLSVYFSKSKQSANLTSSASLPQSQISVPMFRVVFLSTLIIMRLINYIKCFSQTNQSSQMVKIFSLGTDNLQRPPSFFTWLSKTMHQTFPPNFSIKRIAAFRVPPVANTSSKRTTLSPYLTKLFCISIVSNPYSKSQFSSQHQPGSFPFFLIGQHGFKTFRDSAGPNKNPLDSSMKILEYQTSFNLLAKESITSWQVAGLETIGKMSMKLTPGLGKFQQVIAACLILVETVYSIKDIIIILFYRSILCFSSLNELLGYALVFVDGYIIGKTLEKSVPYTQSFDYQ